MAGSSAFSFGRVRDVSVAAGFDLNTKNTAFALGFKAGAMPLSFEGYGSLTGPKGNDGFGQATRTEFLFHPKLMVDVGALAGTKKETYLAGIGWEYWHNKFGADHTKVPGAIQSTPFAELAVRF